MTDNLDTQLHISELRRQIDRLVSGKKIPLYQEDEQGRAVLDGQGNPVKTLHAAQVQDQVTRMYHDGHKTTRPMHYFDLLGMPDVNKMVFGEPKEAKIRLSFHSFSDNAADQIVTTLKAIGGNKPIYIAGSDMARRGALNAHEMRKIMEKNPDLAPPTLASQSVTESKKEAAAYVIPPQGDLICAQEMLQLIDDRLAGRGDISKPIILYDRHRFWHHLRDHLPEFVDPWAQKDMVKRVLGEAKLPQEQAEYGSDPLPLFSPDKNIWAAYNKEQLRNALTGIARGEPLHEKAHIPEGSTLLVATKTNEKIYELQKIFEGYNLRIMRLDPFTNFTNPQEESGTFCGNAMEKILSAQMDMAQNREALTAHFKRNGIDPEKVFILAEDSGVYIDNPNVFRSMHERGEFGEKGLGIDKDLVIYADQAPGVEFGPFANSALGENSFWQAVNNAIERLPELKDTKPFVSSLSTLALSPFRLDAAPGSQPVYLFSGNTHNWLRSTEQVKQSIVPDAVPTTADYLAPIGQVDAAFLNPDPHDKGSMAKSEAELGRDYLAKHSPRSFAANALIEAMNVPKGMFRPRKAPAPLRLAALGDDTPTLPRMQIDLKPVKLLTRIDFASTDPLSPWTTRADQTLAAADIFQLTPRKLPVSDAQKVQDLFLFFSLIVSKQLDPRDKDKAILLDRDDPYWNGIFGKLYDHLRRSGMVSDQQDTFISRIDETHPAADIIARTARNHFVGTPEKPCSLLDHKALDSASAEDKGHSVAVFCSATARNQPLNDEAEALGEWIAGQGSNLVYGAADKEMMGAVLEGFRNGRESTGTSTLAIGSSTVDILQVESKNPKDVWDKLDVYFDAETIYERMQFMFEQADSFAIIPGGAGTVQELAALLGAKLAKNPAVEGKPILLYNKPLKMDLKGETEQQHGFYQPLIDFLGEALLAEYGVKICNHYDELTAAIAEAKQTQRATSEKPSSLAGGVASDGTVQPCEKTKKP